MNMTAAAPIAAFVGTTPNIGTTAAAFAAAFRLAEATGKSVGYFCLNLKGAKLHRFIGVDEPDTTLDELHPELRSQALTPDMLRRAMHRLPGQANLHALFGSMNRDQAEFVRPEDIHHLIDTAARAFAFVVLDVGAYWDNAATVCSVQRAGSRILVTTPALSHFQEDGRRWIGQVSPLFQVTANQFDCLVVQYPWSNGGYDMRHICKELGASPIGRLRLSESMFGELDKGAYAEWLKLDRTGRLAMKEPALTLLRRHRLQEAALPAHGRQPWFRKLLVRRSGGARTS